MVGEDGQENVTHRDMLTIFDRVTSEVKEEMKEKGREGEFIGARVSNSLSACGANPKLITPDYIRHPPLHCSRGTGMVYRGLHCSKERIS